MPLFSIIIPVYNLADFVLDTLSSIEAQTFSDYEVIIVDDGSTDATAEVCQEWCRSHQRFSLYSKENGGVSSARNLGIERASGDLIWFIDGDDFIHPDSLMCLNRIFAQNPGTDYISFKYSYTQENYRNFSFPEIDCNDVVKFTEDSKEAFFNMLRQTPYAACCICIKSKSIGKLRFIPICTSEDTLFALQLTYCAQQILVWNAFPYYYYQRPGSFVNSEYSWRKFKDFIVFIERISGMKGEKNGWGDGYLAFLQYRSAFPFLCRQVRLLQTIQERHKGQEECFRLIEEHCCIFHNNTVWYMPLINSTKSYFLVWIFLVLRYDLRDMMLKSSFLSNIWKKLRS